MLAGSAGALEIISAELASEVFDTLEPSNLDDEQASLIVEAVQNASDMVRNSFEGNVNVFEGHFDTYVPIDSLIPVGERRTLVVITASASSSVLLVGSKTKSTKK